MNPSSIYPVILAIALALGTVTLVHKIAGGQLHSGKYSSIDGLRGYLAFFVFLHHSLIWFFFLRTDDWVTPPSNMYTNFGETSVSLFFMITGFLFFSKLVNGKKYPIDWLKLFISRILRLTPLYFFAMLILFSLIGILSGFILKEPRLQVLTEMVDWLTFTVRKAPLINGFKQTNLIMANVTWTLVMEWLFYLSLPFIGLIIFKLRTSVLTLVLTCIIITWIALNGRSGIFPAVSFSGGMAAAFLVRSKKICVLASKKLSSVILMVTLGLTVFLFHTSYTIIAQMLIAISFVIIACGNTFFGLLTSQASKLLGQISYSIYLLHAIVLFIVFKFIIGFDQAKEMSPFQHWLIILASVVPLIIICTITYYFIELPAMNASSNITGRFRKWYNKSINGFARLYSGAREISSTTLIIKETEEASKE